MQSKITCFLIDDDPDDQEIFALALGDISTSIQCITANDGIEALKKLKDKKTFVPDYIFIDLNMPRMNGMQCLSEIKKLHHLYHVPVIIYSTSSNPKDMLETKQLGACDYIVKQASIPALRTTLEEVLQKNGNSITN